MFHLPACPEDRSQVFFVPPARLPVIAHIVHGYSLREIATHFGCSVTTVHRRVYACGDGRLSSAALAAGGTKKI